MHEGISISPVSSADFSEVASAEPPAWLSSETSLPASSAGDAISLRQSSGSARLLGSGRAGLARQSPARPRPPHFRHSEGFTPNIHHFIAVSGEPLVSPGGDAVWLSLGPRPRSWLGLSSRHSYAVFDADKDRPRFELALPATAGAVSWSPDGCHLAISLHQSPAARVLGTFRPVTRGHEVRVIDALSGLLRASLRRAGPSDGLIWSPDGQRLLSHRSHSSGQVALALWSTEALSAPWSPSPRRVSCPRLIDRAQVSCERLLFSWPDGRYLLAGLPAAQPPGWQVFHSSGGASRLRLPDMPFARGPIWVSDLSLLTLNRSAGGSHAHVCWWDERAQLPGLFRPEHVSITAMALDADHRELAIISHPEAGWGASPASSSPACTLELVSLARSDAGEPRMDKRLVLALPPIASLSLAEQQAMWAPAGQRSHLLVLTNRDTQRPLLIDTRSPPIDWQMRELPMDLGDASTMRFSPCGHFLVVASTLSADTNPLRLEGQRELRLVSLGVFDTTYGHQVFSYFQTMPATHPGPGELTIRPRLTQVLLQCGDTAAVFDLQSRQEIIDAIVAAPDSAPPGFCGPTRLSREPAVPAVGPSPTLAEPDSWRPDSPGPSLALSSPFAAESFSLPWGWTSRPAPAAVPGPWAWG